MLLIDVDYGLCSIIKFPPFPFSENYLNYKDGKPSKIEKERIFDNLPPHLSFFLQIEDRMVFIHATISHPHAMLQSSQGSFTQG
jgi:hypothetical protein